MRLDYCISVGFMNIVVLGLSAIFMLPAIIAKYKDHSYFLHILATNLLSLFFIAAGYYYIEKLHVNIPSLYELAVVIWIGAFVCSLIHISKINLLDVIVCNLLSVCCLMAGYYFTIPSLYELAVVLWIGGVLCSFCI